MPRVMVPTQRANPTVELGPAFVFRIVLTFVGVVFLLSAFGLWLVPGATGPAALSLMRLGVSLFMLLSGMCCLSGARALSRVPA